MNREYHKWFSPSLRREMELLVFGHAGERVLVFPAREGRFYDYENWRILDTVANKIDQGQLQLFCVDSIDSESLYCQFCDPLARIHRHDEFERYVRYEVLPLTERMNEDPRLVVHGCSIGAYHAVNFGLRHPELVTKIVAFSGRYDLTRVFGRYGNLFPGYYDDNIYFHTPAHFVPNVTDGWMLHQLRRLDVTFAVGSCDPVRESNAQLSEALWAKGVPNAMHVWDGEAHRPRDWRKMAPLYL